MPRSVRAWLVLGLLLSAQASSVSASDSSANNSVDTLFISDLHIGEGRNTWEMVEAALAHFRGSNPSAAHLVYAGDTIKHSSPAEDDKADEYILRFVELARKHGFSAENIFVAQGNNDGPHDQPLSPKWARAVAASGLVPSEEQVSCLNGSYYAKCATSGVCGIVVNTDLEVYGSGSEEAEDKAVHRNGLSAEQVELILETKQRQRAWVAAKAQEFQRKGQPYFMVGHHPQLKNFFDSHESFKGGIAGHLHLFIPTGLRARRLTVLPGYTSMAFTQGYLQGHIQGNAEISLRGWWHLVRYDYKRGCFFVTGSSCSGQGPLIV